MEQPPIMISGHVIGLLKEYMRDLVEQAAQESRAEEQFGFRSAPYRSDQAISDLLALLDDRIESEGMQVGLPENFLHRMWSLCNDASSQISERVWLEGHIDNLVIGKTQTRELTYRALIEFIESRSREGP
ncbi:MAG: hypothetical protein OEV77_12270 [Nitrospira sp.]|nr:hypothetical protein [Nitrospira sp.]MDH4329291.1 hypothetical protein [Nitrospira sp.]